MRCVAVIGNGGGGKSTLCRALGERTGTAPEPVHRRSPRELRRLAR